MCNLYDIGPASAKQGKGWRRAVIEAMQSMPKVYGIRKTDTGLVALRVSSENGVSIRPEKRRWGFVRPFNAAINNARIEKLADGMWKTAWESGRRCVIPVASFYEWSGSKGAKQTHAFQSRSELGEGDQGEREWSWMAGLWEDDPDHGPCYTMLTTAGTGVIASIHDRMPAILKPDQVEDYLELPPGITPEAWLERAPLSDDLHEFRCLNPLKSRMAGPPVEDAFLF